jgi:hypothetical protein
MHLAQIRQARSQRKCEHGDGGADHRVQDVVVAVMTRASAIAIGSTSATG